ncbi:MAG: hypothetical protein EAX89_06005 [Candidatus Lokiarchaeota archaeon]|nr:hypothetical protein [Candidatus Lokiarchaeota archaeon]
MNLKKDYQKIYEQWLQEFEQSELTSLTEDLFNFYKEVISTAAKVELKKDNTIQNDLLNTYKKNLEFLFEDLLKIREIKIMNSALALKEINLDHLIEAERLLFQNLVATIKGYKKVKALSFLNEEYKINEQITIKANEKSLEKVVLNEITPHISEEDLTSEVKLPQTEIENEIKTDYNYILIRFIKKTPPLVGIDLKDYGPFEENDIANLPNQNATILLNEKFAEKIDID